MRWRFIILTSLVTAVAAFGAWAAITVGVFGTARALARHDWLLLASALLMLVLATFAGTFAYRHTARRRKTQAILTAILSLLISGACYVVAQACYHEKFYIPRTSEVRHAR